MLSERPKVCASGEAPARRRAQGYSYARLRSSISQRKYSGPEVTDDTHAKTTEPYPIKRDAAPSVVTVMVSPSV